MKQNCIFCDYLNFTTGYRGWSDYTPGLDFDLSCSVGRFSYTPGDGTSSELLVIFRQGEYCPHFNVSKSAIEYGFVKDAEQE